jgi:hypothetical protein
MAQKKTPADITGPRCRNPIVAFGEGDGGFAQGEYAFTLSLTDTAACRSPFHPLRNKAQTWTLQTLRNILKMNQIEPFPKINHQIFGKEEKIVKSTS